MADKQEKVKSSDYNLNGMNAGMFGLAIPMPVPVFTPQVMPIRMIPPFWPTNNTSFMQQYMETVSSGMVRTMNQSTTSQKEQRENMTSRGDAASLSLGKGVTAPGMESTRCGYTNQLLTNFDKRQGVDLPRFPNPVLFPFGGFVPFGSYFPFFNAPVSGLQNKQNNDWEGHSSEDSPINELRSNDLVDKMDINKPQSSSDYNSLEKEESQQEKPVIKPSEEKPQESTGKDSHSEEISNDNSPEMDVAQILVNFMPVPVIGNTKRDEHVKDHSEKVSQVSLEEETKKKDNATASSSITKTVTAESTTPQSSETINNDIIPGNAMSVEDYQPTNSAPAVKDVTMNTVSVIKELTPEVTGEVNTACQTVTKAEIPVHQYKSNPIPNGDLAVIENSTSKPSEQIGNAVPESTVILLFNGHAHSQPQDNHASSVALTKNESQHKLQMQIESKENGAELMELGLQSVECQQGMVSDDDNTIPTVDDLLKGDLGNDKSTYKCEVCAQLFRSSLGLQKHLEFHMDDGQHYTCTICFQPFKEAKTLDEHIAQHMRKRPHKCKFCPKAFRDPGSLQKHVRVHTGEKPYKCTSCYQSFAEYSSLRKHLRVHTGEQPYRCQYCNKAFSISGNLQRHVLIHTGERPYKCSFCPKAFNNPSHLRRHVKNLHFKGEMTTGVVEDMISALHGDASAHIREMLAANEVEIETTGQNMENSQQEEEKRAFTPKTTCI